MGKFKGIKRHGPAGKALAAAVAGGVPGFGSVKFWGYIMVYKWDFFCVITTLVDFNLIFWWPSRYQKQKPAPLHELFGRSFHRTYRTLKRLRVQTSYNSLLGFPQLGIKIGLPTVCRTMAYQPKYL